MYLNQSEDMMTMQPHIIEDTELNNLSKLLHHVINSEGWTVNRLSKETGLSQNFLEDLVQENNGT